MEESVTQVQGMDRKSCGNLRQSGDCRSDIGSGVGVTRPREVERDVHNHVFLTANHTAPSKFEQNLDGRQAVT